MFEMFPKKTCQQQFVYTDRFKSMISEGIEFQIRVIQIKEKCLVEDNLANLCWSLFAVPALVLFFPTKLT